MILMMTPDVNVIEADLPVSISAYVVPNADMTFTIVLNSRMAWERRVEAYKHELQHIQNGDYQKSSADMIEFYAHELK